MNIIVYRVVNKVFKDIFLPWGTVISARIISARLYRPSFREHKLKTGSINSGTDLMTNILKARLTREENCINSA
jgi:hypothetical protein